MIPGKKKKKGHIQQTENNIESYHSKLEETRVLYSKS